jgi:hypothetical protein
MEATQLIHWMRQPESLNNESLAKLKEALEAYPCFTTLRMLYQKNLLELQDGRFTGELVRTAISTPDRRRLFLFMEGLTQENLPGAANISSAQQDDFSLIDRFLRQSTEQVSPIEQWMPETETPSVAAAVQKPALTTDEVVDEFGLGGFTLDYLKDTNPSNASSTPLQGHEWIDAYLEHEHPILSGKLMEQPMDRSMVHHQQDNGPVADDLSENEAVEALIDTLPEDSFSEALAKIYLKQKRYDKALEIIKSLRLKYPEKNSYFADQIRFLEKLILLQQNN